MSYVLDFHDYPAPGHFKIVVCEAKSPVEWAVYAGAALDIPEDPEKPPCIKRVGAQRVGTYKPKKGEPPQPLEWAKLHSNAEMPAFVMPDKIQMAEWKALRVVEAALGPMLDPMKLTVGDYEVTTAAEPEDADQGRWVIYKGAHLTITEEVTPQWILTVDGAEVMADFCLKAFTPEEMRDRDKVLVRMIRQFATKEVPGFMMPNAADRANWQMLYARALEEKEEKTKKGRSSEWPSRYPRNYPMPEEEPDEYDEEEDEERDAETGGKAIDDPREDLNLSDLALPGTRQYARDANGMGVETFRLDPAKLRAINLRAPYDPVKHRRQLLPSEVEATLPCMRAQEKLEDPTVHVKFFCPDGALTWFATEYDSADGIFFGYVDGDFPELGYWSLEEMMDATGPLGMRIERDVHFRPTPLSKIKDEVERQHGWHREATSPSSAGLEAANAD